MLTRITTLLTTMLLAVSLVACASEGPSTAKTSKADVEMTRSAFNSLAMGTPKEDVLASFTKGYAARLGSSSIKGTDIEEWKIEAYHDDDWNKTQDRFIGFMYFANAKLVDVNGSRIDYRNNDSIISDWTSGAAK